MDYNFKYLGDSLISAAKQLLKEELVGFCLKIKFKFNRNLSALS